MAEAFERVPWEIAQHIFSYLDPTALGRALIVSRGWFKIASRQELWDRFRTPLIFFRSIPEKARLKRASVYVFYPETQAFVPFFHFPHTNHFDLRGIVHRGQLYFLGGFLGESLSPSSTFYRLSIPVREDSQVALNGLPYGHYGFGFAASDDYLYLFGGTSNFWRYSIPENKWTRTGLSLKEDLAYFSTVAYKGVTYIIGGKTAKADSAKNPKNN